MPSIVFLTTYSLNEPVIKNRLTPFIDQALDRGFNVTLVSPDGGEYGRCSDVRFTHIALDVPQANRGNFLIRTVREVFLAARVLRTSPDYVDYVFLTMPSMFLLLLPVKLKASVRVLDIRDLVWEYLDDSNLITRYAKNAFRFLAMKRLLNFNFVSTTNEEEKNYLLERTSIDPSRVILCPNGVSKHQFHLLASEIIDHKQKLARRPLITYIGNVGLAQNLVTLVEVAKLLPSFDFRIVGDGSDMARVSKCAVGVQNIELTGRLEWSRIPEKYQETDILYAQLKQQFSSAMPSKLYEYLITGKPVVYGGAGHAPRVISEFENLFLVEPESVSSLAYILKDIVDNLDYIGVSKKNRELIALHYVREVSVERFYDLVMEK